MGLMSIYKEYGLAEIAVTIVQSILVIVNLAGNSLVCFIVLRNQCMRTSINCLLMNLAIADITIATFLLPRYVLVHTFTHPDGVAGKVLCRLLTGGNVAWIGGGASVFTLVAVATERYFAALHPFGKKGNFGARRVKMTIACSWIFGIVITFPMFLARNFDKELDWCVYTWSEEWMGKAYSMVWFLFTGFFPVIFMIVLYSQVVYTLWFTRSKPRGRHHCVQQGVLKVRKRVTLMVITVSIIFGVTWLADTFNFVLYYYKPSFNQLTYAATSILVLFNSAINPILYALINQRFKEKMKGILSGKCRAEPEGMFSVKKREKVEIAVISFHQSQLTDERS